MKMKILYSCLGIFFLIILSLGNHIVKQEPVCEREHLDEIDRTKDIVPNEETARKIAESIIEADKQWIWEENIIYEIDITFNELNYEWFVDYHPEIEEGAYWLDGGKNVRIRRDNGLVTIEY